MGAFDFVSKLFARPEKIVYVKQDSEVARMIAPVFREVPPESKTGKFLSEGFRSWASIAISAIADEISTTDIFLYRKVGDDWVNVEAHPILSLIEKPNNFQTKEEFFWLATVYWLSEGEAPIYLNSPRNPTEMVLLNPERLTIIFDEKNIVGGYRYRQTKGTDTIIPAENLLMLKIPSVNSPFRGAGISRYISQTLDIDNFTEEYLKLFFYNDTTPGAVLQTEQELTQTIVDRIKHQFTTRHQGVKNSHKLAILEKGLKYNKISSNVSELELKDLNEIIRDKILAAFKVPKSVLGIVEDVNRANAEASSYTFSKRAIQPKLLMIEGQLNQFLVPKFGMNGTFWLEFEPPVFEDKVANTQLYASALQNGWMTVNEVREKEGLDPLEESDTESPNAPKPPKKPTGGTEDEEDDQDLNQKQIRKRVREKKRPEGLVDIMKDILKAEENAKKPKEEFSKREITKYHDDKIIFLDFLERAYIEELNRVFASQQRKVLGKIANKRMKKVDVSDIELALDVEEETNAIVKASEPYLYEAMLKEGELAYGLLGLSNDISRSEVELKNFIRNRTLKLGAETTKTTNEAVERILQSWAMKDESWTELRASLQKYFTETEGAGARARADMIARTELSNAAGYAQTIVYEQTGATGKQWATAQDEKVCDACLSMNDKFGDGMVVGINDNFFELGETLPDGNQNTWEEVDAPPLHPNCRCDIYPVYTPVKSNKPEMLQDFEGKKEKIRLEAEREKEIEKKQKKLEEKERKLEEKAVALAESIKRVEELEQTKADELKKIETYADTLDKKLG